MAERDVSQYAKDYYLKTEYGYCEEKDVDYYPLIYDGSEFETMTYIDNDGKERKYPNIAQGNAKLANESDLERDELGFTNPNLHRRIDPKEPIQAENPLNQKLEPRKYILSVHGVYSYRNTKLTVHDEEQTYLEIP